MNYLVIPVYWEIVITYLANFYCVTLSVFIATSTYICMHNFIGTFCYLHRIFCTFPYFPLSHTHIHGPSGVYECPFLLIGFLRQSVEHATKNAAIFSYTAELNCNFRIYVRWSRSVNGKFPYFPGILGPLNLTLFLKDPCTTGLPTSVTSRTWLFSVKIVVFACLTPHWRPKFWELSDPTNFWKNKPL